MKRKDAGWQNLVAAARRAGDERATGAPYGFATRVAALALSERRSVGLLERFSWRALGVAALLAVVSVVANYSIPNANADEDALLDESSVASVFDLS